MEGREKWIYRNENEFRQMPVWVRSTHVTHVACNPIYILPYRK